MDLSDLPTGTLAYVSSYLPAPSRALFAVALNHRDSSSAIVGNHQWDVLDFGEIEKDLAAKISDDDMRGVLLYIDAVNNLKRLRLTNCINITGVGLDPLRGSTIIQQIDLSLVGDHESPMLDPEPPISCTDVLPILGSIIERGEDCSLKHLVFPKVWRNERNTESDFHAFLTRYNGYLSSRADICLNCSCNLPGDGHMLQMDGRYRYPYGTQNFTCYDCKRKYCDECENEDGLYYISACHRCERSYCAHCKTVKFCHCCENDICVDCIGFKECSNCHENTCLECARGCHNACCADKIWCNNCFDAVSWCEKCNESYCRDCCDSDVYAVEFCYNCETSLCGQCRVKKCKEGSHCERRWGIHCERSCEQLSFPVLLKDREKMQAQINELQTQINELENERREQSNEINELKREVKDLTGGSGELAEV
eukprot:scaffold10077_cov83-Skeletonema_dohrnii-CCMP3373.AAC.2